MTPWQVIGLGGAVWFGVTMLLSLVGGWCRLATKYPPVPRPEGKPLRVDSTGSVRWGCGAYAIADAGGLYLYHWPIFGPFWRAAYVPWSDVYDQGLELDVSIVGRRLDLGGAATIEVTTDVWNEIKPCLDASSRGAPPL